MGWDGKSRFSARVEGVGGCWVEKTRDADFLRRKFSKERRQRLRRRGRFRGGDGGSWSWVCWMV